MKMGMIGLGKMGGNMAFRLSRGGVHVIGYDRSPETVAEWVNRAGLISAGSVQQMVDMLQPPRILWLMLPSGQVTEDQIHVLGELLEPGDVVVDGGNSNYHDSQRRGDLLKEKGIGFMDAGTSGGVWGLENGYCMMVGASPEVCGRVAPLLRILAPAPDKGWAHVGPVGSGHFVKMIHNGVEYGMMQALAEGFALMSGKKEYGLDMAQVATLWQEGSVVRSWLLDLTAEALRSPMKLQEVPPYVADSGEGRWTVMEAIEQGVPTPVLSLALQMRFQSQDAHGYTFRLLSMMRHAFGGHAMEGGGHERT